MSVANPSTNASSPPPANHSINPFTAFLDNATTVLTMCTVFGCVEFAVLVLSVPVALLFAHLVCSTSVLHRNLKAVLCAQTLAVLGNAAARMCFLIGQFATGNVLWFPPTPVYAANLFFVVASNLVGHAMMVERILATVWVTGYEDHRKWTFTAVWTVLVASITGMYVYSQVYVTGSVTTLNSFTFLTYLVAMTASFVEIFILCRLTSINEKIYKILQRAAAGNGSNLSTKYQLTENIRAGRQLGPVFVCQFVGILITFCCILNLKFGLLMGPHSFPLVVSSSLCLIAANNLLMLATGIAFHPLLNRNARNLLQKLLQIGRFRPRSNNTVTPAQTQSTGGPSQGTVAFAKGEQDVHFNDLKKMWGD